MKNWINKIKKAVAAFWLAWKTDQSPAESRVENLATVIDAVHRESEMLVAVERIAVQTAKSHVDILNKFFNRIIRAVMPDYLVDMYLADNSPIPNLEMFIHQFKDLKEGKTGQDVRMKFHGRYIGHIIITSTLRPQGATVESKELYAVDTDKGAPYEPESK